MKNSFAFGLSMMMMMGLAWSASPAVAADATHTTAAVSLPNQLGTARLTLKPTKPATMLVADNVVVTPSSGATAPAQQPAAQATATQTAPAAPAQQAMPAETSHTEKVVHTNVEASHNYMGTVALSALMGGVVGALVGGSIYYLGDRSNAQNIGYWAAGGVLLGTGVGVVQIMVQEGRASNATALNKLPSDPAPTFRLALFRTSF